jgi:hypothetical protein
MNLGFADALRRRLEPAWPFTAFALSGLAGLCDAALDIAVDRVVQEARLLAALLLRLLRLLRFLRHIALQQ